MKHNQLKYIQVLFCLLGISFFAVQGHANILVTKHNLSVGGPGTITATEEDRVCIFCHNHEVIIGNIFTKYLIL